MLLDNITSKKKDIQANTNKKKKQLKKIQERY
jgi:hypothetical protein